MPRTPDSFPGTRYEDSVVFSSGSSFPSNSGELSYATGTISGSGFFVNEGSDIRRVANPTMSGGIGIIFGVNLVSNAVTASVDNRVVATLTGSVFTGPVVAQGGLTGSLQRLSSGETYLAQGTNVTIVTQSNGQIVISATGEAGPAAPTTPTSNELGELFFATVTGSVYRKSVPIVSQQGWLVNDLGMMMVMTSTVEPNYLTAGTVYVDGVGSDVSASYIVLGTTSSLPNERSLAVGTGIAMVDAGPSNTVTLSIKNDIVATISGSNFSGPVTATGGLTGSLQKTLGGLSYLVGGSNVTVVSQSNGQIMISAAASGGSGADVSASYIVVGVTSSLPNDRSLAISSGLTLTDGGAGSSITLGVNNNIVATITGSNFSGPVIATGGLTGSLQLTSDGLSYLVGGANVTIASQSNGQLVISAPSVALSPTGSQGTYGENIQVNQFGQVTSASLDYFGRHLWFTGSINAAAAHNTTAVLRSALNMTASGLTAGTYRLGWNFTWRYNLATTSYWAEMFIGTTSSWQVIEEPSEVGANERQSASGFAYINVTGSTQIFDLRQRVETAATNVTASMYERFIELWKVS